MTWTILIVKKSHNGWFVNYIENKLINQIEKFKLEKFIDVLIFEPNMKFFSDYVSVIDDEIEISDNFIDAVYNKIKNGSDCVGLKGVVNVNKNPYYFNNISKNDNEIYLPVTKLNPIKTEIIFNKINNIIYYINSEVLLNLVNNIDNVDCTVVFLEKFINIPISIIVTAYQTQDYIEECLDSIEKQSYFINNDNFEVLVGVDACQDTFDKLEEIKHKYRNLSIYMMSENKGTYITTNTLIDLVENENIIRFDSDDIMTPNLVKEVFNNKKDNDVIMLGYVDIKDGNIDSKLCVAGGIIYFKKSIMDNIAGGYQPWKCAADSEMMMRLMNKVKISQINKILFYRRIHNNSLTKRLDTGHNSIIRNDYTKQIKSHYKDDEIKIERVVNDIRVKHAISIIVTAYQTQDYIEECLDSIEKQSYFINNDNFEVLVGVDACQDTLIKLQKISHKYRNIKIFMMSENKGTYITTNTLIDLAENDNIIRFDSDDIMIPNMIEKILTFSDKYKIIRFGYYSFDFKYDENKREEYEHTFYAFGALFFNKDIFKIYGGYQPWLCAADLELLTRIGNDLEVKEIQDGLFYRRVHDCNLTESVNTGLSSNKRKEYLNEIYKLKDNNLKYIIKEINTYEKIKNLNLLYMITTYNRLNFLKKSIDTWYQTKDDKYKWTLIIADDNSTDGTIDYLDNLKLNDVKIIIIKNKNRGVHHQDNQLIRIASHLDFDFGFKSDDDVLFLKPGWDNLYFNAANKTGYKHLIFYDKKWGTRRNELRKNIIRDNILENCVSAKNLQGAFWTFTKDVIKNVGFEDIEKFGLTGLGHVDFSMRCCRAGFNDINNPFDIKNSNDYINLNTENYVSSCNYSDYWNTTSMLKQKNTTLDDIRIFIPYNESDKQMNGNFIENKIVKLNNNNEINYINEYFDHIYCLNLDKRLDKWKKVKYKFNNLNIIVERFSAVDGNNISSDVLEKFNTINKYEVGCVLSHYEIIKDAQKNNYRKILIFEDDVRFIKNFNEKFITLIQTITNWKLLYFGSSQWYWNNIEIIDNFYYPNQSDGTFAYAIDSSLYQNVLNTNDINDKPIDYKLWKIQKENYKKCYNFYPNLIISDVSDSNIRKSRNVMSHSKSMRWNLSLYDN